MHGFEVLADPVRRRILELLAGGAYAAGDVSAAIGAEFGISQPAVSQHLKVLREAAFVCVHKDGTRRLYQLDPAPLAELEDWMARLRPLPAPALDALGTEIARGKRERRRVAQTPVAETGNTRRRTS